MSAEFSCLRSSKYAMPRVYVSSFILVFMCHGNNIMVIIVLCQAIFRSIFEYCMPLLIIYIWIEPLTPITPGFSSIYMYVYEEINRNNGDRLLWLTFLPKILLRFAIDPYIPYSRPCETIGFRLFRMGLLFALWVRIQSWFGEVKADDATYNHPCVYIFFILICVWRMGLWMAITRLICLYAMLDELSGFEKL